MPPLPPWLPQQVLTFTGQLATGNQTEQFNVLAGDSAPTIKGGWTKIQTIDRPRRKGFTMPVGYDPISIDVPIRFDATTIYHFSFGPELAGTPADLEVAIQRLEWMAGRGKLYANGSHPAQGDPPTVWVASYDADGQTLTNLIPRNLLGDTQTHPSLTFLITNIQYDDRPLRNTRMNRQRQDATVSLVEQVTVPGDVQSPRQRQQGRGKTDQPKTYYTTQAADTIQKVCQAHGITNPAVWKKVLDYNRQFGWVHVTSYLQSLPPGTPVQIPLSYFWQGH